MIGFADHDDMTRLWSRNFALYFVARAVSLVGDAMMPVATALAVGPVHGTSGVGFVLALWTAPFVLLVLFGGVLSDRLGARPMMVGADLARIATQSTVAVLFFTGTPSLWLLMACSALAGAAAAMFQPGVNGIVPHVARDLQRANASIKVADSAAQLLGPAVAGILVATVGAGAVYTIDAATFAMSAACLLALRIPTHLAVAAGSSVVRDLRVGWREFRSRTWIWVVILVWVAYGITMFGPIIPIGSTLVGARLGDAAYGWVVTGWGAGAVVGGFGAMRVKPTHPLRAGAVAMFGWAVLPLAVVASAPLWLLLTGHLIAGAAWSFWSVMWATSVQTHVPSKLLNRVTAYEVAGSVSGIAVGQALAGPATLLVGGAEILGVSAAVCIVGAALLLAVPAVRNLRRDPPPIVPRYVTSVDTVVAEAPR
ncbi:putative MFS family arabinose efflux permease [Micromonospora kangleipakensis]|uniref:Putative MFS family arabinose efflux permease n=2 Tax=Micromonospora kangleipakensis TaxID=1077942 RepID=A0A4Q8BFT8_9ACTN|nr:putative MFS family arabinose efflux permease [Micromonospora kangleipakensis]